jgi:hypothetical protein
MVFIVIIRVVIIVIIYVAILCVVITVGCTAMGELFHAVDPYKKGIIFLQLPSSAYAIERVLEVHAQAVHVQILLVVTIVDELDNALYSQLLEPAQ